MLVQATPRAHVLFSRLKKTQIWRPCRLHKWDKH